MQMIKLEMCPGDMDAHADAKFAYSHKANKSSASSTVSGVGITRTTAKSC